VASSLKNETEATSIVFIFLESYVELSPMPLATDEDEPLTVSSTSYKLDQVVDMVIS
jgi:hypothetical protein